MFKVTTRRTMTMANEFNVYGYVHAEGCGCKTGLTARSFSTQEEAMEFAAEISNTVPKMCSRSAKVAAPAPAKKTSVRKPVVRKAPATKPVEAQAPVLVNGMRVSAEDIAYLKAEGLWDSYLNA